MTHEDFITGMCCEFELAFLSTGLKPVRWSFGDGTNDGCMVTALDVSEHGNVRLPPPGKGFWASLKYDFKLLSRDARRVRRVRKLLAAGHVEFDQEWWDVFVSYCIRSFDGRATFPRRWMKRNRCEPVRGSESPKLMGAAVGGLVQRHVFSAASRETRTHRGRQPVQGRERQGPAFWPSYPSEHPEANQGGRRSAACSERKGP
jgi:hypothetical protein